MNTKAVLQQGKRHGHRKTQKSMGVGDLFDYFAFPDLVRRFCWSVTTVLRMASKRSTHLSHPPLHPMSCKSLLIPVPCWFQLLSHLIKRSSNCSTWAPYCHQLRWGALVLVVGQELDPTTEAYINLSPRSQAPQVYVAQVIPQESNWLNPINENASSRCHFQHTKSLEVITPILT